MSSAVACDVELLEALAFDELPLEQARRALEHAGACQACRGELSALREDRARFHARAAAQPALPRLELFAQVQDGARLRARRERVRREVVAFALCAASLLCVLGVSSRTAGADASFSASAAGLEVRLSPGAEQGPRYSRDCGMVSVDEIERLEADLGACLVATPVRCR